MVNNFVFPYRCYKFNNTRIGFSSKDNGYWTEKVLWAQASFLVVFDGLLPRVCYFLVFLCSYSLLDIYSCMISQWAGFGCHSIIFENFQDDEGDFKPNNSPPYIPNEMKGNPTYKCYNRRLVNTIIVFVLNIVVK